MTEVQTLAKEFILDSVKEFEFMSILEFLEEKYAINDLSDEAFEELADDVASAIADAKVIVKFGR